MKVGLLLSGFEPQAGGGYTFQGEVLQGLADLAGETSHRFIILCPRPDALDPELRSRLQVTACPGRLAQRVASWARRRVARRAGWASFASRLEEVAHQAGVEFLWFVGGEGAVVDIPYLATVWDLQHRVQPWFPEVSAAGVWQHREAFYGTFLRRAASVIAGTAAGREEIERFYQVPASRIKLLPHPTPRFALEPPATGAEVLARYGIPPGYLFYPAQFWSHKNHVNLLHAARKLRDEHGLTFPVVLVGSDKGIQRHVRETADQLGLSGQVFFLGFVPVEDLVGLYRNAFALTYVTFFGPENLPPLEAFGLGCPVVASRVAGSEEQLGDAALLADPRDPGEIARCVKALHDDANLRNDLVRRGRERAAQRTAGGFVRGVFALLDEFEPVRRCWGQS